MKSLNQLLYKNMLRSSLIPLLFIELALLSLYFVTNSYTTSQHQQTILDQVFDSVQSTSQREARFINLRLTEVSRLSELLRLDHERFIQTLYLCDREPREPVYAIHENGALYKKKDEGGASLYYSSATRQKTTTLRKAACSETIDPLLKYSVQSNPLTAQAYFNTWDNMVRVYPFIDNSPDVFGPQLNLADFNFYYLATHKYNPNKHSVWTNAYLDPAGQGWMISNIVPIYNDDFLEGVSGIDVTLEKLIAEVLNLQLPDHAYAFLLDDKSTILAMQKEVETLLGLKELTQQDYDTSFSKGVEKPNAFNIFHNEELSEIFLDSTAHDNNMVETNIAGQAFFINSHVIPQTNWQLVTLIDKEQLLQPAKSLKELGQQLGWLAMFIMVAFYLLFFLYLKAKSKHIANQVAEPLQVLSSKTKDINKPVNLSPAEKTNIAELDLLSDNFFEMAHTIKQRSEELIASNQAKSDFLTNISHELRTPLNAIVGFSQLLKNDEALTNEQKESVGYVLNSGLHLLDLINQILDMSRIESGKLDFHITKVNLNKLIGDIIAIMQVSAKEKQLALNFASTAEEYQIDIDELRLKQILINIIGNAIKFTPQGHVSVSTSQLDKHIIIEVEDSGIGIAKEHQETVFQPFEQIKVNHSSQQGTGLGLGIAKEFVETMGGEIVLTSQVNKGTTIRITFPVINPMNNT